MSATQRFESKLEEFFSQKFNFRDKVVPYGTTLEEYLKSTEFIESTPNNFSFSCPGPRNIPLSRQFEQFLIFARENQNSQPIQNSIFPLFCHIVMKLKKEEDKTLFENFTECNINSVPEKDREEASKFVHDEEFYKKMACLFSTQWYKILCDDDTANKIKNFLFKSGHSQLRLLYTSIIIFVPDRKQQDDHVVYSLFSLNSPTSSLSIVQARVNAASFAAISNNEPAVYACCNDQNILKIDSKSQKVTNLYKHSSAVTTMCLSKNSNVLLTADLSGSISLWSPSASCQLSTKFTQILCSTFAPHGGIFALGTGNGLIHIYDTPNHHLHRILIGHHSLITSVAFHPNCAYLGSLSIEPAIRVWDLREATTVRLFTGQTQKNSALAFSNDGKTLAVFDGELSLFDIGTQKQIFRRNIHTTNVNSLNFSMDSRYIYAVSRNGDIVTCDVTQENSSAREILSLNERVISTELLQADELRIVTSYEA